MHGAMGWLESLFQKWLRRRPEWQGQERREGLRVRCDFELEIQAPGARYMAQVVEAGPQGLRMRVRGPWNPKAIRPRQEVGLKFVEALYGCEVDTIGASIRWVRREGPHMFSLAIRFLEDVEVLKRSWVKPMLQRAFKKESRRNQREWMRARCQLPARLHHQGVQDVKIHDLSTTGCRLACLQPIAVGSDLEVEFQNLKLRAVVRRCQPDYGVYRLGLVFAPNAQAKARLLELVKQMLAVDKFTG